MKAKRTKVETGVNGLKSKEYAPVFAFNCGQSGRDCTVFPSLCNGFSTPPDKTLAFNM